MEFSIFRKFLRPFEAFRNTGSSAGIAGKEDAPRHRAHFHPKGGKNGHP
jgi:hypothetical protein